MTLAQSGYIETSTGGTALQVVIVVILLVACVVEVWGLFDASSRPTWAYERAKRSRLAWILLQLIFPVVGSATYLLAVRPQLRAVAK